MPSAGPNAEVCLYMILCRQPTGLENRANLGCGKLLNYRPLLRLLRPAEALPGMLCGAPRAGRPQPASRRSGLVRALCRRPPI